MPKRNFNTLSEFQNNLHKHGVTLLEFGGRRMPCILVGQKEYDEILQNIYQKHVRVDTLLDIFYNGRDVFVDVCIKFIDIGFEKNYLLYANDLLEFFEMFVKSGLMAMAPDSPAYSNSQNVFMIQIPNRDAAEHALEIIKTNIKKHS